MSCIFSILVIWSCISTITKSVLLHIFISPLSLWLPSVLTTLKVGEKTLTHFLLNNIRHLIWIFSFYPPFPMCMCLLFCQPFHFLCSSQILCSIHMGQWVGLQAEKKSRFTVGIIEMLLWFLSFREKERCECVCVGNVCLLCHLALSETNQQAAFSYDNSSFVLIFLFLLAWRVHKSSNNHKVTFLFSYFHSSHLILLTVWKLLYTKYTTNEPDSILRGC